MLRKFVYLVGAAMILAAFQPATGASPAGAQGACASEFAAVSEAITDASFGGQEEKTEARLLAKVANAQGKLEQGKTDDAVQKLIDVRVTVARLIETGKVDGGEAIIAAVDETIACLESSTTAG